MKKIIVLAICLAGFAVTGFAAADVDSYPSKMVSDISEIWKNIKVTEDGKWPEGMGPVAGNKPGGGGGPVKSKVPQGGTVTGNGAGFSGEGPVKAFDGHTGSKYCVNTTTMWLQYQYPKDEKKKVLSYALTSANDSEVRDPKDWKLLGSNDGKKWDELDARSGEKFTGRFQRRTFDIKKSGEYSQYKLDVTANNGDVSSQIAEVELLTKAAGK